MTEKHPSLSSLLYGDLFYYGPGAEQFQRKYLLVWVTVKLAQIGAREIGALHSAFEREYPGSTLDRSALQTKIGQLCDTGLVEYHEGAYRASPKVKNAIALAEREYEKSRSSMMHQIVNHVRQESETPLSRAEATAVEGCIEELLIRSMLDEKEALELLYSSSDSFDYVLSNAQQRRGDLLKCLARESEGALQTRFQELREYSLQGLAKCMTYGSNYIHTLNRTIISSFFLIKNPDVVQNIENLVLRREYFIDSNVYFAWRYESQIWNSIVSPFMEVLVRSGTRILLLEETVGEIELVEEKARKAVKTAEENPSYRSYIRGNRLAISCDYLRRQDEDPNLDYETFERLFVGVRDFVRHRGLEIIELEGEGAFVENEETIRNVVRGQKKEARGNRHTTEESVEHDVALLQKVLSYQRTEGGREATLLSLDTVLNQMLKEIRNVLGTEVRLADNPLALARMVLPSDSKTIGKDDYERFVIEAIREDLSIAVHLPGYGTADLIEQLDRAGVPIKTLVEKSSEEMDEAIAILYSNKNIGMRLRDALATRAEERVDIIEGITKDLEEVLLKRSRIIDEREKEIIKLSQDVEQKRILEKRALERMDGLEARLSRAESRNNKLAYVIALLVCIIALLFIAVA